MGIGYQKGGGILLRSQSKIDPQYANKKMKFNTMNKMMLLIGVLLLLASGCGTFFHPGSSKGFFIKMQSPGLLVFQSGG